MQSALTFSVRLFACHASDSDAQAPSHWQPQGLRPCSVGPRSRSLAGLREWPESVPRRSDGPGAIMITGIVPGPAERPPQPAQVRRTGPTRRGTGPTRSRAPAGVLGPSDAALEYCRAAGSNYASRTRRSSHGFFDLFVERVQMLKSVMRPIFRRKRHLNEEKPSKTDFSKSLPEKKQHKLDLQIKVLLAR